MPAGPRARSSIAIRRHGPPSASRCGRVGLPGCSVSTCPPSDVPRILEPLGFQVATDDSGRNGRWTVTVPSFRGDVTQEADLVEEVGRHYGFDRLPITFPAMNDTAGTT